MSNIWHIAHTSKQTWMHYSSRVEDSRLCEVWGGGTLVKIYLCEVILLSDKIIKKLQTL